MSDQPPAPFGRPAAEHLIRGAKQMADLGAELGVGLTADAFEAIAALAALAFANALLAIETRLGELAEQKRLANVIAVCSTDISPANESDRVWAELYVQGGVGAIVRPDGGAR